MAQVVVVLCYKPEGRGFDSRSSYADCLEIWEPQHSGTLRACPGTVMGLFYLLLLSLCIKFRPSFEGFLALIFCLRRQTSHAFMHILST